MNFLFRVVTTILAILTAVILLSFVYFWFQRRQQHRKHQKVQTYLKQHQGQWHDYLVHQVPLSQPLNLNNATELTAIETILFSYSRNFSDKIIQIQISCFANEHLKEQYGKMLKSRHWNVRMNTLYRVLVFGITELLPNVQKMMRKPKSKEEYFRILKIYSRYLPNEFFTEFFKVQDRFGQYQFKKLFSVMTDETRNQTIDSFQKLSTDGQYAAIDVLGKLREFSSLSFLYGLLESNDTEIRIRTLKAINEIKMIIDVERMMPFVESNVWQEKLLVARLFEDFAIEQVKPVYLKLIEDSNWWVRNEAARVLSMTKEGRMVLETVMEQSNDAYAVDVSKKFLLRGA